MSSRHSITTSYCSFLQLELTAEIAAERGAAVDVAGFEAAMQEQRRRSKDAAKVCCWDSPYGRILMHGCLGRRGCQGDIVAADAINRHVPCDPSGRAAGAVLHIPVAKSLRHTDLESERLPARASSFTLRQRASPCDSLCLLLCTACCLSRPVPLGNLLYTLTAEKNANTHPTLSQTLTLTLYPALYLSRTLRQPCHVTR